MRSRPFAWSRRTLTRQLGWSSRRFLNGQGNPLVYGYDRPVAEPGIRGQIIRPEVPSRADRRLSTKPPVRTRDASIASAALAPNWGAEGCGNEPPTREG